MSNPYIEKEVTKIFTTAKESDKPALAAAWIIAHFKGINIKIMSASETGALCDYNVIASAENTTQAKSMVDEILSNLRKAGLECISIEGLQDGEWILLDMGDIIIHIFQELSRDVYDLDSLWAGASQVQIPQEYYFGPGAEVEKKADPTDNYF